MTHGASSGRMFVEFTPCEGAIVRMIGLVERRGFIVRRVAMAEQPCGRRATLTFMAEGRDAGRSLDTLALQLGRLHGVSRVDHETARIQDQAA
jgi:acetolactate synthase-1/3 small subunit/acetolactate synthase II small subunit